MPDPEQSPSIREDSPRGESPVRPPRRARLRVWGFRLAALTLVPLVVFGLAEFILRLAGTGWPATFFIADADDPKVLTDNHRFGWRFFPRELARSSKPIRLGAGKPSGVVRVFVLGGSAAMGDPEPAVGIARQLEVLLESRVPDKTFELVNTAMTAVNSHVVLRIARECAELDGDAWIVYLGNNEVVGPFGATPVFGAEAPPRWLIAAGDRFKSMKLGQMAQSLTWKAESKPPAEGIAAWRGMEMFMQFRIPPDSPVLERIYKNFRANLGDLLEAGRDSGALVLTSTVGVNVESCPPFASERAETEFQRARVLLDEGNIERARDAFANARDLDTLRFRADSTINAIIRETTSRVGTPLIDGSRVLANASPEGLTGDAFFHEHVHLNFSGNHVLARAFAEQLVDDLNLPARGRWLTEQECARRLAWTPVHEAKMLTRLRQRLDAPPFEGQSNHEVRDGLIASRLDELRSLSTRGAILRWIDDTRALVASHPADWIARRQLAILFETVGDLDGSIAQWRNIADQLPHATSSFRLGAVLNRARRWTEAESSLRGAIARRPDFAMAWNSLGICLSHQNRFDESLDCFAEALRIDPGFADAHLSWAMVLENQNHADQALEHFRKALTLKPDLPVARFQLGRALIRRGDPEAALPHYEAAAHFEPRNPSAQLNLGLLHLRLGHREEAIATLESVLKLDPKNQTARQTLKRLESAEAQE